MVKTKNQINTAEYWDKIWRKEGLKTKRNHATLFNFIIEKIPVNSSVLDIGCGAGIFLDKVQKEKNCDVYGVDIAPVAIGLLSTQGMGGHVYNSDTDELTLHRKFDVIVATELLEHVTHENRLLEAIKENLTPTGTAYISVPNNTLSKNKEHQRTYNTETLYNVLLPYFSKIEIWKIQDNPSKLLAICSSNREHNPEKVSAVIPVYNEEGNIARCIEGLLNQTHPPDEIILMDDCSTDRTVEIASQYPVTIHTFENRIRSIAASRAKGTYLAKNNIILSTDGDTVLAPDWIEKALEALEPDDVIAVTGRSAPLYPSPISSFFTAISNTQHKGRGYNTMFKRNFCTVEGCYIGMGRGSDWRLWDDLVEVGRTVWDGDLIAYTSLPTYAQRKNIALIAGTGLLATGIVLSAKKYRKTGIALTVPGVAAIAYGAWR